MKFLFVGLCFYIVLLGDYGFAQKHKLSPVGGYHSINADDENVQKLALFSLDSVTQQTMSKRSLGLFKVLSAKSQVVAGINYKIQLLVCEKDSNIVLDDKNCRSCDITIWEQSWLNSKNVTKVACSEPSEVNSFFNVAVTKRDVHENVDIRIPLNSDDKKVQDIVNSDFTKKGKVTAKKNHQYDRIQLKEDFENFINTHNKKYSSLEEKEKRLRIFSANMKRVKLLQNNEQGNAVYGATQFADLTKNEFKKKYLGLNQSVKSKKVLPMAEIPHHISIPNEFDWRDHNAVTPVKNQGSCGSCWAFSAIANIEGQYALKSGKLLSLSEQELIDCDNLDNGCGGGLMTQAFEAVENLGGVEIESDYPYEGHADRKGCQLDKSEVKVSISKAVNVSTNEDDIAKFLVSHGPLSVGVNANAMQFYMGGVSHPIHALCSSKSLDHGVAIVGYGIHRTKYTHKNLPYWLIKNSWGSGWGEKGYYLLYRGDGSCGVNQMVSSAII